MPPRVCGRRLASPQRCLHRPLCRRRARPRGRRGTLWSLGPRDAAAALDGDCRGGLQQTLCMTCQWAHSLRIPTRPWYGGRIALFLLFSLGPRSLSLFLSLSFSASFSVPFSLSFSFPLSGVENRQRRVRTMQTPICRRKRCPSPPPPRCPVQPGQLAAGQNRTCSHRQRHQRGEAS